jgi:hydrophobe/amphiphile efflux-3 (HAE3) family protein
MLERVVAAAGRRPGRFLAIVALLAAVGAGLALRLEPSAATETLVGKSSDTYQATERYRERFGDHAVVILVRGDLQQTVLTKNLGRLLGLEGCIAGNKPAQIKVPAGGANGPCAKFVASKPVQVVYGPGTFINAAVGEIQTQLAAQLQTAEKQSKAAETAARKVAASQGRSKAEQDRLAKAARQVVEAQFTRDLLQMALRYGLSVRSATPQLNNPDFVSALVFDPTRCATCPKARFAYLFPNQHSAVIQVRLKPGLTDEQRKAAIGLVREAVAMPEWKLEYGASYVVTGAPVLVSDLTDELSSSLLRLLVVGLLLMALVLAAVFRSRLRLLPLAIALAAVAVVFGLMSLLGAPLTMASIAVLPVLLGLGVDYAIQYQARVEEDGVERAARVALPTIATAGLATVAGFLVLLLSPVPMVRGFGVLLVAGILFAFIFALSAGTAALVSLGRRSEPTFFGRSVAGAGELLAAAGRPLRRPWGMLRRGAGRVSSATLRASTGRPGRVLAVGFVLALAGWGVDSQTKVVTDIRELVPRDLPAVRDLVTLQDETDVAGEIDVIVEGADLTDPKVITWMRSYQERLLKRYRYSSKSGCGAADLCPALSLTDLFRSPQAAADQQRIRALLDAVPPYFSEAVMTSDRRTATLAFGIKLMPLDRQKDVIDVMRRELDPPKGVSARLAGLPVLAAEANAALSSPLRRFGTLLAGLLLVGLVLLIAHRRANRGTRTSFAHAWIPLVPIALATGWSALVLFLLGVPLNPMSATLGALVIAISTEFAVLLTARYREERSAGLGPEEALRRTYASTGAAVLASGATAIAGFAVLAFSDVQMLKDFGRVTVVDLTVSLLGVLAVLPAVLIWAERRAAAASPAAPEPERELVPVG